MNAANGDNMVPTKEAFIKIEPFDGNVSLLTSLHPLLPHILQRFEFTSHDVRSFVSSLMHPRWILLSDHVKSFKKKKRTNFKIIKYKKLKFSNKNSK